MENLQIAKYEKMYQLVEFSKFIFNQVNQNHFWPNTVLCTSCSLLQTIWWPGYKSRVLPTFFFFYYNKNMFIFMKKIVTIIQNMRIRFQKIRTTKTTTTFLIRTETKLKRITQNNKTIFQNMRKTTHTPDLEHGSSSELKPKWNDHLLRILG